MQATSAESLFSTLVKNNRERLGWSQVTLAARLREHGMDVHATGIARLENGDRAIRLNEAMALIRVLEIDADRVLPTLAQFDASMSPPVTIEDRIRSVREVADAAHEMLSATLDELLSHRTAILPVSEDKADKLRDDWETEQAHAGALSSPPDDAGIEPEGDNQGGWAT